MVGPDDEVFAMTSNGGVIRTTAAEIKQSGRQTMGVRLMNLADGASVVAIARNVESIVESEALEDSGSDDGEGATVSDVPCIVTEPLGQEDT